jgi:hypothetical protein
VISNKIYKKSLNSKMLNKNLKTKIYYILIGIIFFIVGIEIFQLKYQKPLHFFPRISQPYRTLKKGFHKELTGRSSLNTIFEPQQTILLPIEKKWDSILFTFPKKNTVNKIKK